MGCISALIRNVSSGKRQIDVQPTVKVVVVHAVISIASAMPMMHPCHDEGKRRRL